MMVKKNNGLQRSSLKDLVSPHTLPKDRSQLRFGELKLLEWAF
jgi:hypothetical protein